MKPHNQATWSFGKLALLVVGVVAAGGMSGAFGDGTAAPPDLGNLFKVTEAKDQPAQKPKKERLVGVVVDHVDGRLLIAPLSDDPMTYTKATPAQQERCPRDARYPDCL